MKVRRKPDFLLVVAVGVIAGVIFSTVLQAMESDKTDLNHKVASISVQHDR